MKFRSAHRYLFCALMWCFSSLSSAMTFEEAMRQGMSRSRVTSLSKVDLERSQVSVDNSKQRYWPSVEGSLGGARSGYEPSLRYESSLQTSLGARWNVYRFGADRSFMAAQEDEREASELDLRSATLIEERRLAKLFLNLIYLHLDLELARRQNELKKSGLALVEQLYRSGLRPSQDVSRLKIDVDKQLLSVREKEIDANRAKLSVERELGGPANIDAKWPFEARFSTLRTKALAFEKAKTAAQSASAHPSVQAEGKRQLAAQNATEAARSGVLPRVDLATKATQQRRIEEDSSIHSPETSWTVGLELTWPIITPAEQREEIQAQTSAKLRAEIRQQDLRDNLTATSSA